MKSANMALKINSTTRNNWWIVDTEGRQKSHANEQQMSEKCSIMNHCIQKQLEMPGY